MNEIGKMDSSVKTTRPNSETSRKVHISSLDGIRALAILSVFFYHMDSAWLPSGHMGVVLFLVLSGYLMTYSLLKKFSFNKKSYIKRLKSRFVHIWPEMICMIFIVLPLCVIFNHLLLTKMKPDIVPAIFMSENIAYIFKDVSYFDAQGAPSPLLHLWYLGIDAQFAILWPLVLAYILKKTKSFKKARKSVLILSVVSAVLMAVLYRPGQDPSRIYYGLDTRAFSLLLGAWLAFIVPLDTKARSMGADGKIHPLFKKINLLSLAALVLFMFVECAVPATSNLYFYGGMYLVSLLCLALIIGLVIEDTYLNKLFSHKVLVWIGKRSYALYLWHYPIILLLGANTNSASIFIKIIALVLSIGISDLSYRFVETYFIKRQKMLLDNLTLMQVKKSVLRHKALALICIGIVLFGVVGAIVTPDEQAVPREVLTSTGSDASKGKDIKAKENSEGADQSASTKPKQDLNNLPDGSIYLFENSVQANNGVKSPVVIGDSVPGACNEYFEKHCPDGLLDAYVGRRPDQMFSVLRDYLGKGVVGDTVVLQAFANTVANKEELNKAIESLGDRDIYLVTACTPNNNESQINDVLYEAAEKYKNVEIIDWRAQAKPNQDSWLYPDHIHLRETTRSIYVDMISNAVKKSIVKHGGSVYTEEQLNIKKESQKLDEEIKKSLATQRIVRIPAV